MTLQWLHSSSFGSVLLSFLDVVLRPVGLITSLWPLTCQDQVSYTLKAELHYNRTESVTHRTLKQQNRGSEVRNEPRGSKKASERGNARAAELQDVSARRCRPMSSSVTCAHRRLLHQSVCPREFYDNPSWTPLLLPPPPPPHHAWTRLSICCLYFI